MKTSYISGEDGSHVFVKGCAAVDVMTETFKFVSEIRLTVHSGKLLIFI